MGHASSSAFHQQFLSLDVVDDSVKRVWVMYDGVLSERCREVTVWKVNTSHNVFVSSLRPPASKSSSAKQKSSWHPLRFPAYYLRVLCDHKVHQHCPNLLPMEQVEYRGQDGALYAMSSMRYSQLLPFLPRMCPTEVLLGLRGLATALDYLHNVVGVAHRAVSFDSLYLPVVDTDRGTVAENGWDWILGDFHFVTSNMRCDQEGSMSASARGPLANPQPLTPETGERLVYDTASVLDEICLLRDATQLVYVAPEETNTVLCGHDFSWIPIGAGDVFAFGVIIDQLLMPETRLGRLEEGSPKLRSAIDRLRSFAKQCQSHDPLARPRISAFFSQPLLSLSTLCQLSLFLETIEERSRAAKLRFFWYLHLELLKIPYEQLLRLMIPKLLTVSIFSDPCAEVFIEHLLVPVRHAPGADSEPLSIVDAYESVFRPESTGAPTRGAEEPGVLELEAAPSTEAPSLPPSTLTKLHSRTESNEIIRAQHQRSDSLEATRHSRTESTERQLHQQKSPPPQPQAQPHPAAHQQQQRFGLLQHDDYVVYVTLFLSGAFRKVRRPRLLAALLRSVHLYAAAVPMRTVFEVIIPKVIMCLRHPADDVVVEALRAYVVITNMVFSAISRGKEVGPSRKQLVAGFSNELFGLAVSDRVLRVRLLALQVMAYTISNPGDPKSEELPRPRAIDALWSGITAPIKEKAAAAAHSQTPGELDELETSIVIARRIVDMFLRGGRDILSSLTPKEAVMQIMPACFMLAQSPSLAHTMTETGAQGGESDRIHQLLKADTELRGRAMELCVVIAEFLKMKTERVPSPIPSAVQEASLPPRSRSPQNARTPEISKPPTEEEPPVQEATDGDEPVAAHIDAPASGGSQKEEHPREEGETPESKPTEAAGDNPGHGNEEPEAPAEAAALEPPLVEETVAMVPPEPSGIEAPPEVAAPAPDEPPPACETADPKPADGSAEDAVPQSEPQDSPSHEEHSNETPAGVADSQPEPDPFAGRWLTFNGLPDWYSMVRQHPSYAIPPRKTDLSELLANASFAAPRVASPVKKKKGAAAEPPPDLSASMAERSLVDSSEDCSRLDPVEVFGTDPSNWPKYEEGDYDVEINTLGVFQCAKLLAHYKMKAKSGPSTRPHPVAARLPQRHAKVLRSAFLITPPATGGPSGGADSSKSHASYTRPRKGSEMEKHSKSAHEKKASFGSDRDQQVSPISRPARTDRSPDLLATQKLPIALPSAPLPQQQQQPAPAEWSMPSQQQPPSPQPPATQQSQFTASATHDAQDVIAFIAGSFGHSGSNPPRQDSGTYGFSFGTSPGEESPQQHQPQQRKEKVKKVKSRKGKDAARAGTEGPTAQSAPGQGSFGSLPSTVHDAGGKVDAPTPEAAPLPQPSQASVSRRVAMAIPKRRAPSGFDSFDGPPSL